MNERIFTSMFPELPKKPTWFRFTKRAFTLDEMRSLGSIASFNDLDFVNCPITDEQVHELATIPRLARLNLEGSKITDAALEDLASLPRLAELSLERTGITGEGLRFFHGHKALKTLRLTGTKVSDRTVGLAVGTPKLADLYLTKTAITFEGLLSLASHPTLTPQVSYFDQFAPEQEEAFPGRSTKACLQDRPGHRRRYRRGKASAPGVLRGDQRLGTTLTRGQPKSSARGLEGADRGSADRMSDDL